MTFHCLKTQLEGVLDLKYLLEKNTSEKARTIIGRCLNKWKNSDSPYSMASYCSKKGLGID